MKIAYINPNSTQSMTQAVLATARATLPDVQMIGLTNSQGPAAIQGAADGLAAVPGMLALLPQAVAQGADAIVIACFDDTGLAQAQAMCPVPVLGIGQASYAMARLIGRRFSVVTSLAVSVPVILENITLQGFAGHCASVRASGLPVLTIDEGGPETIMRIADEMAQAVAQDAAGCVVLGCAGMAHLRPDLAARCAVPVIDGVAAAAHLAQSAVAFLANMRALDPV